MGLDDVELVMTVEEAFEINIDDIDAEKALTVGGLFEIICQQCSEGADDSCITQRAFYTLRKGLTSFFKVDRKEIRPDTTTESLFAISDRRTYWKDFQESTGLKLPNLQLSRRGWNVVLICWTIAITAFSLLIFFKSITTGRWPTGTELGFAFSLYIFGGPILLLVIYSRMLSTHLATSIPDDCQTIGGLTSLILIRNTHRFKPSSRHDIWVTLRTIVSKQLGVEEDLVTPEAKFVDDLGLS